jgi:acyl-CoA reductase-like NAD-dependent aldehyde dehydrogenase
MAFPPVQRTVSPIDGSVVAEREIAGVAAIERVLGRAVAAQRAWRATPLADASASSSGWCRGWSSAPA